MTKATARRDISARSSSAPEIGLAAHKNSGQARFVSFRGVEKSYDGRTLAVRSLDLDVARGEFLTLLGPSGSGKTTTLNMLAGFERPTRGTIELDGRSVDRLPPYERNIGMVFQNYALFPHMTVEENVGFPLSVRGQRGADVRQRVSRALDMIQLSAFGKRKPGQLSGGQQQRVALARALVFEPSLVLMDEPLGALDKKLREHMQLEIKQLHVMLGITVIYVTHDQTEALTMSDRIAIFNKGGIAQMGSATDVYDEPENAFVAGFIGESNLLKGTVVSISGGECRVRLDGGGEIVALAIGVAEGQRCRVSIRPEKFRAAPASEGEVGFEVSVVDNLYLGDHLRMLARLENGQMLTVKVESDTKRIKGEQVCISCLPKDCRAFPADEE